VSERSERALRKTSIRAATKLTYYHSTQFDFVPSSLGAAMINKQLLDLNDDKHFIYMAKKTLAIYLKTHNVLSTSLSSEFSELSKGERAIFLEDHF